MTVEPIRKPEETPKRNLHAEAVAAIEFLNRKASRNFKATKVNTDFCLARLREGYSLQELKIVVVMKCREWKGTEMDYCLRPATLFNCAKFNSYAGFIPAGVVGDNREATEDFDIS